MTTQGFRRKLSAILMADVVGYSRLMGENEAATLKTLTTYQGIMDGLIRQHRGRVVDSPGDALLAEFSSVVDAVQCAVAVQKELEARNAELPENSRMQFRIGINLGDIIEEGEKIYGDGVNIAARLEALAEPGGICISKTAFDHIETKLSLGYEFLGEKAVKNIVRPVSAYRVLLEPRVTVAGKIDAEKIRPGWTRKVVVAAALVMFMVTISLAVWKSGFLSSQLTKQTASPSPQSPSPPPTRGAPSPQVASLPKETSQRRGVPSPQAVPPKRVTPPAASSPKASPPSPAVSPTQVAPSTQVASLPKETSQMEGAPSPQAAPPKRVTPPIQDMAIALFKDIDANNDGKVTLSEFMAWRDVRFNSLDENRDGSLSWSEVSAGKTKFARLLRKHFALVDSNRDQMISREEFREAGRLRFIRMDANRDGYLTVDELAEAKFWRE